MQVICSQNAETLAHKDDPTIVGWMQRRRTRQRPGDIPDSNGYGPPILPSMVIAQYEAFRKADPTRPVFLNLGRAVAWDELPDRGVRSRHPEDYVEYAKGCDIASFDIYPVAQNDPRSKNKLDLVGRGVERLVKFTGGRKPVWNCIECTRIDGGDQAHAQAGQGGSLDRAWCMGASGIVYFCHEFKPKRRPRDPGRSGDACRGDGDQPADP